MKCFVWTLQKNWGISLLKAFIHYVHYITEQCEILCDIL